MKKSYQFIIALMAIVMSFFLFNCQLEQLEKGTATTIIDDQKIAASDKEWIDAGKFTYAGTDNSADIMGNFTVPLAAAGGSALTWDESSDLISIDPLTGEVKILKEVTGDTVVNLTVTIKKGTVTENKTISLTLRKTTDANAVSYDKESITSDNFTYSTGDSSTDVNGNFTIVPFKTGTYGSTLTWDESSDLISIDSVTGVVTVTQPTDEDKVVKIKVTITKGSVTEEKIITVVIKKKLSDVESVSYDKDWINADRFTYTNSDNSKDVKANFTIVPFKTGPRGSTLTWDESSDLISIDPVTGVVTVTQPTDEDKVVKIKVTITKGSVTEEKIITVIIKKKNGSTYYTVTITATIDMGSEEAITFTPADKTVNKGTYLYVNGTTVSGATYKWYIDGVSASSTVSSIAIDTTAYTAKQYELILVVTKDGVSSSGSCRFTVKN